MDSVSTTVKNAMLGAPSIFPTRLSVLSFIFLNSGGGYHWNKKGEADCIYGMPKPTDTMNMADLNEQMASAKKRGEEQQTSPNMNFQLAELKLEKIKRKHVAEHIELYSQRSDIFAKVSMSDMSMLSMTSDLAGTLFGTLYEPKKLNKEWANAADEVASACLKAVRAAKADGSLPPHMKTMEASLVKALDTLEPITHRRENTAKAALSIQGIWDELKMDDALGL